MKTATMPTLKAIEVQGYPFDICFTSDGDQIGICRLPDFDCSPSDELNNKLITLMTLLKTLANSITYRNVAGRTTLYIKEIDKDQIQSLLNFILDHGYAVTPIDNSLITLLPGDKFDVVHTLSRLLDFIKTKFIIYNDGYRLFRVVSLLPIHTETFWEGLKSDPSLYDEAKKIASDAYQIIGEQSQSF